jgi:hypothetical protein
MTPHQIHWLTKRWAQDWQGSGTTEEVRGMASAISEIDEAQHKALSKERWFKDLTTANRAIRRWQTL